MTTTIIEIGNKEGFDELMNWLKGLFEAVGLGIGGTIVVTDSKCGTAYAPSKKKPWFRIPVAFPESLEEEGVDLKKIIKGETKVLGLLIIPKKNGEEV